MQRPAGAPDALVELGRLVRVELVGGGDVVPRGGPMCLVTSAAGEPWLVAEGGVAPESPAGQVAAITYDTRKGGTAAWWRHLFWPGIPRRLATPKRASTASTRDASLLMESGRVSELQTREP